MIPLLLAATLGTALAGPELTPLAGIEFTPLSRADLVWVDDNRTSGTAVGEFDGTVRPLFKVYAGTWIGPRFAMLGGIGVARLQSTTWVGDTYRQRHWGVIRPSLDFRVALIKRRPKYPIPWVLMGVYGDIPSSRDVSNGYTQDEQDAADDIAYIDRVRLGGVGLGGGMGIDYRIVPHIAVGFSFRVNWHRSVLNTSEADTVTSWLASEGALLFSFEWPRDPKKKSASKTPVGDPIPEQDSTVTGASSPAD